MPQELVMKNLFIALLSIYSVSVYAQPSVEDVAILGSGLYNSTTGETTTLYAAYHFVADGSATEGASTFQWYRNSVEIDGASSASYVLSSDDVGTEITFAVTPVDTSGNVGTTLTSSGKTVSTTSLSSTEIPSGGNLYVDSDTAYLNVTGLANNSTIQVQDGSTLIIYGDIDLSTFAEISLNIYGTLIVYGSVTLGDGANLYVNGSIDIQGNLTTGDDAYVGVFNSDSELSIGGDVLLGDNANVDLTSGTTTIGGDLEFGDGVDIEIHTELAVSGDFVLANGAAVHVNGEMTVDGDFNTGTGTTTGMWEADAVVSIGGDVTGSSTLGTEFSSGTILVQGVVVPPASLANSGTITVLPIELTRFTAAAVRGAVQVNWETASEENNDYFTLERSTDGTSFEAIHLESGAGNSNITLSYSYTDQPEAAGTYYYRLKQTDYDGVFTYSAVVSAAFGWESMGESAAIWMSQGSLNITFDAPLSAVHLQLVNMAGQVLQQERLAGEQSFRLQTNNCSAGLHLVVLRNGDQVFATQKIWIP